MDELPRVVVDNHHHLWTDVLHARALASQTHDHWDRGSYVRWAVVFSCIVLEVSCQDALDDPQISYRFRENLDRAIRVRRLPLLNWGSGTWQDVTKLRGFRKSYVHRFAAIDELFPEVSQATWAIDVVRLASKAIYAHVGAVPPAWFDEDSDRGWQGPGRQTSFAHAGVIRAGVDRSAPDTIRVAYVHDGREHDDECMAADGDYESVILRLLRNSNVPISEIRVYQGDRLIHFVETRMRGT